MFSTSFRRQLLVKLTMFADLCVFTGSVLFAFWVNSLNSLAGWLTFSRILELQMQVMHFALFLIALIVWHIVFRFHRLYESRRQDKVSKVFMDILKATSLGTVVTLALGVVFQVPVIVNQTYLLSFWLSSLALTLLLRVILKTVLKTIRKFGVNLRYLLIVGTNQKAISIAQMIREHPEWGYRVIGYMDNEIYLKHASIDLLGSLKDFPAILKVHVIDEIIITLPVRSHYEEIQNIVRLAEEQGIKTKYMADIFATKASQQHEADFEHYAMTTAISSCQTDWHFIVKRAMDLILGSFLFVAAIPIMLAAAVAIKLTSPGPVLFVQTRVGISKRRFRLYKLRTMSVNAENMQRELEHLNQMDGPVFKINNDPRVTRLGKWLRRTSIDELPQLVNVLKGDMSLVGPRPLPVRDYDGFDKDWQRKRFSVLPGITCIWQISGRNNVPFEEWMQMDMKYIENWSLQNDFKILLKTAVAVMSKNGAVAVILSLGSDICVPDYWF